MKSRRKFAGLSLRSEIAVGVVLSSALILAVVILCSTFGIPFIGYAGSYGHEKGQVLQYLNLVADLKKERLEVWLNEVKGDVSVLAKNMILEEGGMLLQAKRQDQTQGGWGDRTSRQGMVRDATLSNVTSRLHDFTESYRRYSKIALAEPKTGRVIASSARDEAGATVLGFRALQNAAGAPDKIAVDVERDPADQRTYLIVSKAVEGRGSDSGSKYTPILVAFIDMEKFVRPMLYLGEGLGDSGEILLVSQERTILMSLKYPLADGSKPKPLEYRIGARPATLAAQGHEGIIEAKDYRGVPVLAAYRRIRLTEDRRWGLVVKQDRSEIFAPVWSGALYTLLIGIGGIFLVSMFALVAGRRISRPIEMLSRTADEVASGNLDVRSNIQGTREILVLSRTFDSLINRVRNWHDELATEVNLRTMQLKQTNEELEAEIAERKRTEEELRVSEQRYRLLYEKTPVPLHSVDDALRIIYVSDYWLELLGYSRDEVLGKSPLDFLTPKSKRVAEEVNMPRFLQSGSSRDLSYQMIKKNGEVVDVLLSAFVNRNNEGKFNQALTAFYDVTELRRAQRALQQAHDELEQRVRERTVDLEKTNVELAVHVERRKKTEDKLRAVLADLTASNEDLEQFAYVASHDLQEPLRNVAGCLQILERRHKGKLGDDSDQLIHYAVESATKMKALITDLLSFSRISTRGKPLTLLNTEEVVKQALRNLQSAIAETDALVTYSTLPHVMADSMQLVQVFQNLIANALKFRKMEPPRVHVSAERAGGDWVFSVQDHGIGIDSRHFDRIFVIFQQLSKKGNFTGTGIGLATVKKIVERHRGRVWVESHVGAGSTFYFTIPDREVPSSSAQIYT